MARSRSPVSRMPAAFEPMISPVCRMPSNFDTFFEPLTKEEQRAWRSLEDSSFHSLSQADSSVVSMSEGESSLDAISDVSEGDSSVDGISESSPTQRSSRTAMPAYVREQLIEENQLYEVSVPFFETAQKKFKWGGCPYHPRRSLQPHLIKSGPRVGVLCLRCAQHWPRNGQPKCFFSHAFPKGLFGKLPQELRAAYASLDFSLHRGSRGGGLRGLCCGLNRGRYNERKFAKSQGVNSAFHKAGIRYSAKGMVGSSGLLRFCQEPQVLAVLGTFAAGEERPGTLLAMYTFSMRVPQDAAPLLVGRHHNFIDILYKRLRHACAWRQMEINDSVQFQPGVVEWDGMRSTGKRDKQHGTAQHLGRFLAVTIAPAAMSLVVSDDFVLALGAAMLTALELTYPHLGQRKQWQELCLTRMLRITMSCYELRRFLGPEQTRKELHALTLAASVLACVQATDLQDRVIGLGNCSLPSVVQMPHHTSFREQVRLWAAHAWRVELEMLSREISAVLSDIARDHALFQHTDGLRRLFLPWSSLLDEYNLMIIGPPESFEEVLPLLSSKVSPGKHLIASDQGKGLGKAWASIKVEAATACHSKNHFSPLVTLSKKNLGKRALAVLKGKNRAVVKPRTCKVVGGDQRAEARVGAVKRQLRRTNLLGRSAKDGAHVDGLSSHFLLENVGLAPVVAAVAAYREAVQDVLPPKTAWNDRQWLQVGLCT
ncbi:unnamed protein product [Symbiodinium sp. CCMP2456]|nr:unnamed protein product [Symbiodinium sp. CCMP2456]